ncbi:snaclec B6-like, partial [Stylophora pistillata]|uniref:snaclec B6-like n=1 Tax=Stylophora pistillata TaxID=50429 RepID=UPI000C051FFF
MLVSSLVNDNVERIICMVVLFASGSVSAYCPRGWKQLDSFCYHASSLSLTWHQAQQFCRRMGGDLVKITSARENEFVLALARRFAPTRKQVWIGLMWTAYNFYWSDYSFPVYKAWAPKEPNGKSREPCSNMWTGHTSHLPFRANGYRNDRICATHPHALCGLVCKRLA